MVVNIENNRRASSKVGRRDEPKIPKNSKVQNEKSSKVVALDEKLDKVISLLHKQ